MDHFIERRVLLRLASAGVTGLAPRAHEVELVGARAGRLESMSGAMLYATRSITSVRGAIDTLIVAGSDARSRSTNLRARL
jgi:hypothetical protein